MHLVSYPHGVLHTCTGLVVMVVMVVRVVRVVMWFVLGGGEWHAYTEISFCTHVHTTMHTNTLIGNMEE